MKLFRVMNILSKAWWEGGAVSVAEACRTAGWDEAECWVREYSQKGAGGWKKPDKERKKMTTQENIDKLIDEIGEKNQETYIAIRVLRALIKTLLKEERSEKEK